MVASYNAAGAELRCQEWCVPIESVVIVEVCMWYRMGVWNFSRVVVVKKKGFVIGEFFGSPVS